MPRKKNPTSTPQHKTPPPEPKRRGRRKKATEPSAELPPAEPQTTPTPEPAEPAAEPPSPNLPAPARGPDLAAAEEEYARKYPGTDFVRGSLAPAGAHLEFGQKRTIEIRCVTCGATRRLATSDLHHVAQCRACKEQSRRAVRKQKSRPESDG